MARRKSDCTGQRFGRLTVLGKGDPILTPTKDPRYKNGVVAIQQWILQCDCGKIIERPRNGFDRPGNPNPSCGCGHKIAARKNGEKRAKPDCTGQRFGFLTVLGKTKETKKRGKESYFLWALQCDCGKVIKLFRADFDRAKGGQKSCGCKTLELQKKAGRKLKYPPTPVPYPEEAGSLLEKYLFLAETGLIRNAEEIKDRKRDRLIRACWILTYRRQQGELFSEEGERSFLRKHLSRCDTDAFLNRVRRSGFEPDYNIDINLTIGGQMANGTLQGYPVSESGTLGNICDSGSHRRLKFRRC